MAFPLLLPHDSFDENVDQSFDVTPTVKNTFITIEFTPKNAATRRSSVPASSRLSRKAHANMCGGKLLGDNVHSDSTYETEASGSSGTRTPNSLDDLSPMLSFFPSPQEVCVFPQNSWSTPPWSLDQIAPPPKPHSQLRRIGLNSKAAAFQPQGLVQSQAAEPNTEPYKKHIAEVIRLAKVSLKYSQHVKGVEISEDATGWSVIIKPKGNEENLFQTELLTTLAKEALLDAAAKSKCIYVMGYCAPKPFNMNPLGFDATLGAMQSAPSACWHVFKKGFCRHGDDCCKQHPHLQVPVHVIVEGAQLKSCTRFAEAFKEQVADLALTVTAALGENPHVEFVEAFKDQDSQGWSIELTVNKHEAVDKEMLLTLAKNALFNGSGRSEFIYIMGYAAKPFMRTSGGFVTILGDMQDESRVCWDLYSKGFCSRDCVCCWEHPECLMSLNVIVK